MPKILDLSETFDYVPHHRIFANLVVSYRINESVLNLLKSHLSIRKRAVKMNRCITEILELKVEFHRVLSALYNVC